MVKMSMSMNPNDEPLHSATESDELAVRESEIASLPGVIAELGKLGAGAVVTEEGVAQLFNRCTVSVKRAVIRGELAASMGAWTMIQAFAYLKTQDFPSLSLFAISA